jgi:hypothetical protein
MSGGSVATMGCLEPIGALVETRVVASWCTSEPKGNGEAWIGSKEYEVPGWSLEWSPSSDCHSATVNGETKVRGRIERRRDLSASATGNRQHYGGGAEMGGNDVCTYLCGERHRSGYWLSFELIECCHNRDQLSYESRVVEAGEKQCSISKEALIHNTRTTLRSEKVIHDRT